MKKYFSFFISHLSPQKGFTLIEIVLVIALIGITATLLVSLVNPVQQFKKSNDAKRKADLHQLQASLELYRADNDQYPTDLTSCGTALTDSGGTVTYLQKIPCDPSTKTSYFYNSDGQTYTLITCLQNLSDPQKDETNALNPGGGTYCDGTTAWSYTVTNP